MKSLQELALIAVSSLIKSADKSRIESWKDEDGNNPFVQCPSILIESLLAHVVVLSERQIIKFADLKLLLSSHRLTNFELCDVSMTTPDFIQMLHVLSKQADLITKFILKRVNLSDFYSASSYAKSVVTDRRDSSQARSASLQRFLLCARNLRYLATDVSFNVELLQSIKHLERVELNFFPAVGTICKMVPSNGMASSLQHISILEDSHHTLSKEDVLFLLQHCPNLVSFENSIAEALELLNDDELEDNGSEVYHLRKITLGNAFLDERIAPASVRAIQIAANKCPFITELDLFVGDHKAIQELNRITSLQSLLVQWGKLNPCDFDQLITVLQKLGQQLKTLHIINFKNIDFSAIGALCPNLLVLKAEYCGEGFTSLPSQNFFSNLEVLDLEVLDGPSPSEELLQLLLCNCKMLKVLSITDAMTLNDHVLNVILKKNSLENLVDLSLVECSLCEEGLVQLLTSCRKLKLFFCSSSELSMEEVIFIMSFANPNLLFKTSF